MKDVAHREMCLLLFIDDEIILSRYISRRRVECDRSNQNELNLSVADVVRYKVHHSC